MPRTCTFVFLVVLTFTAAVHADDTNLYPKSVLELFEERTGVILIRGTDEMGSVPGKNTALNVRLRETRDSSRNERAFGVFVSTGSGANPEDTTCVDYDELESLIRAVEYVSKVEWSVTPLSHFEAGYTTRAGLKVASYSSRRSGNIDAVVVTGRGRNRCFLTQTQFAQLKVLLEQSKAKIEILIKER